MGKLNLKALQVNQPIGDFYIGVIDAVDLVAISYSDVRTMKRELKKGREKDIREYISTLDATFPNSIIVAIKGKYVTYKDGYMTLTFDDFEKSRIAKVLDGQHRLAGFDDENTKYEDVYGDERPFQLLVTIFVEADISTQAKVFAMVNQNQTKVNPSLVYDLESLSVSRSPDKTAHQIAVLLNKTEGSPFFRRIKRLGVKSIDSNGDAIQGEMLAQAAFVSNIVKLISPKPKEDRNLLFGKKKSFLKFKDKKLNYLDENSLRRCVFRESFIAEKDELIALNISNYFDAIKICWPDEWESDNKKSVLNKTVGFIALIRYLRTAVNIVRELLGLDGYSVIASEQFVFLLKSTEVSSQFFYSVDAVSKSSGEIFNQLNDHTFRRFKHEGEYDYASIKKKLLKQ
jgi:DGQHR domain-containing protein